MTAPTKPQGPHLAVKLLVAAVIGFVLLCVSAFLVYGFIARISGQPGFLGTRASLFADLNLVAEIFLLFGLTLGFVFAKLGRISLHQYNQTAWALLNIVLTVFIMLVAFARQVVPGIPASLLQAYGIVSTLHALLGGLAITCAIYIILRMNNLLPKFLRIKWWRGLMRITLGLYWLVGLFGLGTYAVWYLLPRADVEVPVAQGTLEPGGKVLVPLANYEFVPGDITIPVGATIQFQNADPDPHTVTFDNNEYPAGGLLPGDSYEVLFDQVGVFQIYCEYHGSPGLKGMSMLVRVVAADQVSALPTSVTVSTPTPRPTLPPLPVQALSPNGLGLFQDTQSPNDTFSLTVSDLPPVESGYYYVWLTGDQALLNLGKLIPDANRNANLLYFAPNGQSLLGTYSGFLITSEAIGEPPAQPSSTVVFGGNIPEGVLGPTRQLLVHSEDAPENVGYAVGVVDQTEELVRHAVEIDRAAQGGDVASMNRHIEHLSAILAGKGSPEYIDFEGDQFVDDPGDGFGIVNYANAIAAQADLVLNAPGVPADDRRHAEQLKQIAANLLDWSNQLFELRLAAHNATTAADRTTYTVEIPQVADQILNGVDANGNGVVEPLTGEGGVYTAYFESQYLAAMGALTEATLNAAPTIVPVTPALVPPTATVEVGQPTATTGPTDTATVPAATATQGPVFVVLRNFEFVPAELSVKAGTSIIFTIQDSRHGPYLSFPNSTDIAGFDSGTLDPGASYSITFNNPGTFTIRCGVHPNRMIMTLTVTP
jgi:plastocyanin